MNSESDKGLRKLVVSLVAMGLVFLGFVLTKPWSNAGSQYMTFCGALVAAAGIFVGGNVWSKKATSDK